MSYTLGFIGGGNMAEAIARGAIEGGVLSAEQMIVFDPNADRQGVFGELGAAVASEHGEVIERSEQVMLAVKPQMVEEVASAIGGRLRPDQVVISIMAGVTTQRLAKALRGEGGEGPRIVRVMPNTPMLVGVGASGLCRGAGASVADMGLARRLCEACGVVVEVEESQMDAVTAVSGSGPAYLFYLAEAMEHEAAELGLGESGACLVAQTLLGASTLLSQSSESAGELRRKVMSPGGTTEAAIRKLEERGVSEAIREAVRSAALRSRELAG